MKQTVIFLSAVVLSAVSLKFLPSPFIWVFLLWAAAFGVVAVLSRKNSIKLVAVNLCCASIILLAFETILWVFPDLGKTERPELRFEGSYTNGYFRDNTDYLGYAPEPNRRSRSRLLSGNRLIYDVVYTIDGNGLRIAPQPRTSSSEGIFFFGDSFTFGEGVNDQDSMPYQVAELTHGKFHIFNFGFHGYGPHQMLSALEHGFVDQVIQNVVPRVVIYQAIPNHVWRAAGSIWDEAGPQYVFSDTGEVIYSGPFRKGAKQAGTVRWWFRRQTQKSLIGRRFFEINDRTTQKDVDLMVGIVSKTRDLVAQRWPQAEFHMIFWPEDSWISERLEEGLAYRGIKIHLISDAIPDIGANWSQYTLPVDNHPNARAHAMIARYVADKILKEKPNLNPESK